MTVGILLGPRNDWFQPDSVRQLTSSAWSVSLDSSRIGLRLVGPRLLRLVTVELPPEGMVRGAIQVPPDGQPVVLLADGPVTGGYPAIGVVKEQHLPRLAQAAPGTFMRFPLSPYTP
jgi:allophanate hydrolase subunit 2